LHTYLRIFLFSLALFFFSCESKVSDNSSNSTPKDSDEVSDVTSTPASERITLDEKGVGQIKEIILDPEINQEWVAEGESIFSTNCTACHKVDKRFIGPKMKGLLDRRSPEWIMNMILDPQLMVEEDRCAKDLMVEFNGAAMANQNLTVEESRSLLEYFRTL
jgi:mono/diheme cytochrome c family protein